jgi:hypothetical protein
MRSRPLRRVTSLLVLPFDVARKDGYSLKRETRVTVTHAITSNGTALSLSERHSTVSTCLAAVQEHVDFCRRKDDLFKKLDVVVEKCSGRISCWYCSPLGRQVLDRY